MLRPVGGRWNPRYDFEEIVERHVPGLDTAAYPAAFETGQRFLDAATGTADRTLYHREMLRVLGVERPSTALLAELLDPPVGPPVEPYPEVPEVLAELAARGVPIAVVSDAWPELPELYEQLGLARYIDVFVISAVLGCRKPDPRMYRAGSDGLRLDPAVCLFVDDDPDLVAAALALGYQGVVMARDGDRLPDLPFITSLRDLTEARG